MIMSHLNWIDYAIITLVGMSVLISLLRGFIREALSLVIWVAAVWVAIKFSGDLSHTFAKSISSNTVRMGVSFAILFFATLIIGALVNYLIGSLVKSTRLGGTDRLLGVFFGFARGVLLVAVIVVMVNFTPYTQETPWKASVLMPHFEVTAKWLQSLLPANIHNELKLPSLTPSGNDKDKDKSAQNSVLSQFNDFALMKSKVLGS